MKTGLTRSVLAIALLALVSPVNNASAHAPNQWDAPQAASPPGTSGGVNAPAAQTTVRCPALTTRSTSNGTINPITFATGMTQDGTPIDPRTRFAEGIAKVYAFYSYAGMREGALFQREWCLNGNLYTKGSGSGTWDMGASGTVVTSVNSDNTLPIGTWELRIYIAGQLAQYGTFTIEPIPEPNTNVTTMTIQVARRNVIIGELELVPVWLIKADNVANINYQITYDAKVAKPEGSLGKGNLLDNALFSVNANQSGSVLSGFAQTTGLAGTGTVLNIPFRAVGKPGDRTTLDVTVTAINDPNGGVLKIDRIAGEIVILDKDGRDPTTGDPPKIPRGDCDGDGKVTEVDALCSLEISVNLRPSTPLSDVDNSGDVTSRDAVILLKLAINKP